jgi:hypothetical protein
MLVTYDLLGSLVFIFGAKGNVHSRGEPSVSRILGSKAFYSHEVSKMQ